MVLWIRKIVEFIIWIINCHCFVSPWLYYCRHNLQNNWNMAAIIKYFLKNDLKRPWLFEWERNVLYSSLTPLMGFPGSSTSKESVCSAGDLSSIPGLGPSPEGGHGNPFQYSCLENPHGQRSLVGYSPWGSKESDTTEKQAVTYFV